MVKGFIGWLRGQYASAWFQLGFGRYQGRSHQRRSSCSGLPQCTSFLQPKRGMASLRFIDPGLKGEPPCPRSSVSYKAADLSVIVTSLYVPHQAYTLPHIHPVPHFHTSSLPFSHSITLYKYTTITYPKQHASQRPLTAGISFKCTLHEPRRVHARQQQPLRGIVLGVSGKGLLIDMRPESRQEGGRSPGCL
jgi:hypothetical protein